MSNTYQFLVPLRTRVSVVKSIFKKYSFKPILSRIRGFLPGRWLLFVTGICLVIYGIDLIQERDPRFLPINEFFEIWNVAFRLDIVNIQNLGAALPYLIIGSILCILVPLPNLWIQKYKPDTPLQTRKLAPSYLYPRLMIVIPLFALLIINLWKQKYTPVLFWIWIFIIVMLTIIVWQHDRKFGIHLSPNTTRVDMIWLLTITSLALWLSTLSLIDIPAIMIPDEGSFWETARAIATGEYSPAFFDFGVYTFPVASSILQGWLMRIFGVDLWGWRFSSVLAGTVSLIPLYLLARDWFDRRVAVLSALAMLANPYYLAFTRMGYNNAQAFLPVTLGIYCFSLGYRRGSSFYYWLAGIVTALGFYTYPAAWLGLATIGFCLIFLKISKRIPWREFALISYIILAATLVIAGPRFIYGWTGGSSHSTFFKIIETSFFSDFYGRAIYGENQLGNNIFRVGNNSIFYDPELYGELLTRGLVRTLSAIVDPFLVTEHFITTNLVGGFLAAIAFMLGLSLSLRGMKQIRFSLLLIWLFAGLFFLSVIAAFPPRHTHLISIIPAMALLVALGIVVTIDSLLEWLRNLLPKLPTGRLGYLLLLTMIFSIMYDGIREYFVVMPERNPPLFEDVVSWISWREEGPLHIIYVSPESTAHRVEYLIKTKMVHHSYEAVSPEEFKWNLPEKDSIVFLEWQNEALPELFQVIPANFTESAQYILPEGQISGYAWTSADINLEPATSLEQLPRIPLSKIFGVNLIAIMLYFVRGKISLQDDEKSATGKRLVFELSIRRSEALQKRSRNHSPVNIEQESEGK